MIKFIKAELENDDSPVNDTFVRICVGGIVLAVGGYFYYQYLFHLTHHAAKGAKNVATAPAIPGQPELLVVPDPAAQPTDTRKSAPVAAPAGKSDSLAAVLEPSVGAETVPSALNPPAANAKPATVSEKRISLPPPPLKQPDNAKSQPLTDAEKLAQTARDGFEKVIGFAAKYPDAYGFAPDENLEEARLGDPIPVFTISPQDRQNYQSGQPVQPLLKPTGELIFPITLDGEVRFMVQVKKTAHGYATGDGSKALALVYEKIRQTWPASAGYHPQLLVQPGVPDYYFTVPELPDPNITDTSCMFGDNPVLSPASVILASWR